MQKLNGELLRDLQSLPRTTVVLKTVNGQWTIEVMWAILFLTQMTQSLYVKCIYVLV